MNEGDIVLAPFPQADGQIKKRPAVVLRKVPPFGDLLVCGISTQLHQGVEEFDELILSADPDFKISGLLKNSVIRLGYLLTLPRKEFIGSIGNISPERHRRLLKRLAERLAEFLVSTQRPA
jgi:mRNA interferase MazF